MSSKHRSDKRTEIEYKITKRDSLKFCEEFINNVDDISFKRELESAKNLAISLGNNWTSFIITVDNRINIMFYHNKNAKSRNKKYIIKIGDKLIDLKSMNNILPDELACKDSFNNEDYKFIVSLVCSIYNALKFNSSELIRIFRR